MAKCHTCDGWGKIACPLCGKGKIECSACKGSGGNLHDVGEALAHLSAALAQTLDDKDDPIIMGHVREAHRLLGGS